MNGSAVERILETVGLCVQLGGGIRDMATIEGWLGKGVNRVIIGTAAVRDPALVKEAAKKFPKRVAVGLDAKNGKVAVEGWAATSSCPRSTSRDVSKTPASPRSSTPTWRATACSRASTGTRRSRCRRDLDPVTPAAGWRRSTMSEK
jgi:imidazole glycerol phosphate synthase subunit HisF